MILMGIIIGWVVGWLAGKLFVPLVEKNLNDYNNPEYRQAIATNYPFGLAGIGALLGAGIGALL